MDLLVSKLLLGMDLKMIFIMPKLIQQINN